MKSNTDCFLSYFLGQLHYILRMYVKPLTEVTDLPPSPGEVMSRVVFQRLRKEALCCLLGNYNQEFPLGWDLPDLL